MDNHRCLSNFDILSRLGEGAFGQVYKVKRKSDDIVYALKKIKTTNMKEKDRVNALNQIRILASVVGDHIIGFKDSFYDQQSSDLCIVLQFAAQGDITRKIKEHSKQKKFIQEDEIWKALVHIAKGIRVLHDNDILHRDLKSANIFITQQGVYKLGDLNISKVLTKGLARTQTGTPYYCSPEVWKDTPYGPKSDMWSFGCVLYEMAAQKPPFTASDVQGLYRKVCAGVFQRIPNLYSDQLSDIINSLLNLNPNMRPSTHDILKNPIVQKHYQGNHYQQVKKIPLLQTIQFNKEWKNLNNILPKSQYEIQGEEQTKQEEPESEIKQVKHSQGTVLQLKGSRLKIPRPMKSVRPLSSRSDKKYVKNANQSNNQSEQIKQNKSSLVEREPSQQNKRSLILSAGKAMGGSMLHTPQKPKINRRIILPPLNSQKGKKQRKGSEQYEPALFLPPKQTGTKRDSSKGSCRQEQKQKDRNSSQQRINYRINVVGSNKKAEDQRQY